MESDIVAVHSAKGPVGTGLKPRRESCKRQF